MIYREEYIKHILSHLPKTPLHNIEHMRLVGDVIDVLSRVPHTISNDDLINSPTNLNNLFKGYDKYMPYEKFIVYLRNENINKILK